jgi:FAD:protein FMN transferase
VTTLAAGTDTFSVFGTTAALLVSEPERLDDARAVADAELAAVDLACSRFRPDSELSRLNGCGGAVTPISELFAELIEAALRAARLTDGDVDPTCGHALAEIGYDRDFTVLQAAGLQAAGAASPLSRRPSRRVPGWRSVRLDRRRLLAQLTNGAQLDLGATSKAWAADRCAGIIAAKTGSGVLVSLGGDIAVAGPAPADRGEGGMERAEWRGPGRWAGGEGWRVRVTDDHAAAPDAPGQTVTIRSGGLATSSTTVRTWAVGGQRVHHIINPATGQPAVSCWRTVSVAAGSCVDANTASTAAIIRSEAAPPWLQSAGLPARLVRENGSVETTAGWPSDPGPGCDSGHGGPV